MKIGFYIVSYNRWDDIITNRSVPNATVVVRKSQEELYKGAGIEKVWAIQDDLIDSWVNVMNYVLNNAPEECIVIMDDDIKAFSYLRQQENKITDVEVIEDELIRISVMIHDLELGHGLLNFIADVRKYHEEFTFYGTGGGCYFFNKAVCKSQFFNEAYAVADAEFQLQELMENRLVIYPKYFSGNALFNKGGNTQGRTREKVLNSIVWTQQRRP